MVQVVVSLPPKKKNPKRNQSASDFMCEHHMNPTNLRVLSGTYCVLRQLVFSGNPWDVQIDLKYKSHYDFFVGLSFEDEKPSVKLHTKFFNWAQGGKWNGHQQHAFGKDLIPFCQGFYGATEGAEDRGFSLISDPIGVLLKNATHKNGRLQIDLI